MANPAGCGPSRSFGDALLFSISSMTTIDAGSVRPYLSHAALISSHEALLAGFVLGNQLPNS